MGGTQVGGHPHLVADAHGIVTISVKISYGIRNKNL